MLVLCVHSPKISTMDMPKTMLAAKAVHMKHSRTPMLILCMHSSKTSTAVLIVDCCGRSSCASFLCIHSPKVSTAVLIGHAKNCAGCSCCTLEAQEKICAHFVRAQAKKLAQLC